MKPAVSLSERQRVIDLRRTHSLLDVARLTGIPLGTIKTICSRSGVFRDNLTHRALFSLPPIRESSSTALIVPELPPQEAVTGDKEVDAVLWLRQVVSTGQAALIDKAMLAVTKIKTPLKDIEERYRKHLVSQHPGNLFAALSSFGFADLEGLAKRSVKKATLRHEAVSRFGDDVYNDTEAERFCNATLAGLKVKKGDWQLDPQQVAKRFKACSELMPQTLSDCLHELAFWHDLYALRNAFEGYGDPSEQSSAREWFVFGLLAEIRPRSKNEALSALRYLIDRGRMDSSEVNSILFNLLGANPTTIN